jgi:pyruvate/2-oxoglutarate dehydrogenase complex dihydrolipoamide acyltransferase (E2) component
MTDKNQVYDPLKYNTSWRKMAAAIFNPPRDGKVFGMVDLNMREPLRAIEEWNKDGHHVTATHYFMSTMAHIIGAWVPELNCYARWGKVYQREKVTISAAVLVGGKDLTTVRIHDADKKTVLELSKEMNDKVKARREGKDDKAMATRKGLSGVPWPLRRWIFQGIRYTVYELGIPISGGLNKEMFGSLLVSNIGPLGLSYGIPALMPASNLAFVMSLGHVEEKAIVEDGKVIPCKMLPICGTFDHRVVDGAHIGKMSRGMKYYFNNPEALLSPAKYPERSKRR